MNYSKACAGTSFWAGEGPWSSNENAQEFDHFWDLKRVTSQEGPNQIMKDRKKTAKEINTAEQDVDNGTHFIERCFSCKLIEVLKVWILKTVYYLHIHSETLIFWRRYG